MDKDANNEISFKEFISSIRGEISQNRKNIIKTVFDVIDKDGDGVMTMTDIGACFNPKNHPDVKSGRISVNNLMKDFFESFGTITDTGYVRFPQFLEYYSNVAAFDDDLKFSEMMKSVWLGPPKGIPSLESKPSFQNNNYGTSSMSKLISNNSESDTKNVSIQSKQLSSSLNYGPSNVANLMSASDAGVLKNLAQVSIVIPKFEIY